MFEYKGLEFSATYTIGSKDGKSRSGILKLDGSVYADLTNIRARTKLKITKLAEHSYAIQRV
jgi:hypothetical protein